MISDKKIADLKIIHPWILTMNDSFDAFPDGCLIIDNKQFIYVGSYQDCQDIKARKTIDASGKIIIPPFFNSHSHAPMSLLRGLGNDVPLKMWLEKYIWPVESSIIDPETVYLGSLLSGMEMLLSGTSIFADMYFFENEVAKAAQDLGMRCILGEGILDFPTPNKKTPREGFVFSQSLIERFSSNEKISFSIPAHAPYTCSENTLKEVARFSERNKIPATIHLAETEEEVQNHLDQFGVTPVRYLADLGFFNFHAVGYHCNHLSADDIRILKEYNVAAVSLPNSNCKLASGIAPIYEMLQAGVTVGLGTDGAASNNSSSMLNDMQLMLKLQKVKHLDPTILSAREALRMATLNGAKAYRMEDLLGSIAPGKQADLLIINTDSPHMQPLYDPYAQIAYSMHNEDIESLMIQGNYVMENRKIVQMDEQEIMEKIKSKMRQLDINQILHPTNLHK